MITCASETFDHNALVNDYAEEEPNYCHQEHTHCEPPVLLLIDLLYVLGRGSIDERYVLVWSRCNSGSPILDWLIEVVDYLRNSKILTTGIYKCS